MRPGVTRYVTMCTALAYSAVTHILHKTMASPGQPLLQEEDLVDDADVDTLLREAIIQVMGDNQFIHTKTAQWSASIVEGCLKRLAALAKPFK